MNSMKRRVAAVMVAASVFGTTALPSASVSAVTVVRVKVGDNFFRPKIVTIAKGDKVKWVNRGDNPHTVTGKNWDVVLSPGEAFRKRFRKAGTFEYRCRFHSGQRGTVVVA